MNNTQEEEQKKAILIKYKMARNTDQIQAIGGNLDEFVNEFYPEIPEDSLTAAKNPPEKSDPRGFTEEIIKQLEDQKHVLNRIENLVSHLRSFI